MNKDLWEKINFNLEQLERVITTGYLKDRLLEIRTCTEILERNQPSDREFHPHSKNQPDPGL